jgi:ribosomal protein S18 acetylase RimI-like enzyme
MTTPNPDLRRADPTDAARLTAFINEAYAPAEGFLYDGPRITEDVVLEKLQHGTFLLDTDAAGALLGCVFVEVVGDSGYFGLLAVAPARQNQGQGQALARAAEALVRERGCRYLTIDVVNHRHELFPFYRKLGFEVAGERSFDDERLNRPAHFVIMRKELVPEPPAPA